MNLWQRVMGIVAAGATSMASAQVTWANWTWGSEPAATMNGVHVTYAGDFIDAQIQGWGNNYWQPGHAFVSSEVPNGPAHSDHIRLLGGSHTLTFSRPVEDVYLAVLSLGNGGGSVVEYQFDRDFTILSSGDSYFGSGSLTRSAPSTLRGEEGSGVIKFAGPVTSISWTCSGAENWHAFNVGMKAIEFEFQPPLSDVLPASSETPFMLNLSGVNLQPVSSSVRLHWRNGRSGPFHAEPLSQDSSGRYPGVLRTPPCAAGEFQYYFSVEATDPSGAPAPTVFHPAYPLTDPITFVGAPWPRVAMLTTGGSATIVEHFETPSGWTVGPDTAVTGSWVRDQPVGTLAQPTVDYSSSGTMCWVTGQGILGGSVGGADVDGGYTVLTSPAYDFSGSHDVEVSYWLWFSNGRGSNPYQDIFRVEASVDDGATWTNAETVGPGAADHPHVFPNWIKSRWTLRSTGLSPTSHVRLRFIAEDSGLPSVVEAAIDDLQLLSVACVDQVDTRVLASCDLQRIYAAVTDGNPVSSERARIEARQMGGRLAAPTTPRHQAVVDALTLDPRLWIDRRRGSYGPWIGGVADGAGEWRWPGGDLVDGWNWASGEPGTNGRDPASMYLVRSQYGYGAQWADLTPEEEATVMMPLAFVVEWDSPFEGGAGVSFVQGQCGGSVELTASLAPHGLAGTIMWMGPDGLPLVDGQTAAGTVIVGQGTPTLRFDWMSPSDAGGYRAIYKTGSGSTLCHWEGPTILVGVAPCCPADFNQDGGIDGGDIDAFFGAWEAGDGAADVNQDGGVDFGDVDTFFTAWENGGC